MRPKIRHSPQQAQEDISRKQFEAFLETHEYVTEDISRDLGEDILVRIYDNGVSTGLSFYVQLKSISNINKYILKSGDLSYPFEVKDLEHWSVQALTVLLVIWDVNQNQGWWIWIKDAIGFLQKDIPDWKKKKKVKIHISAKNQVDENGLINIRQLLADLYYPIVSKDKDLTINAKFSFPKTSEGKIKSEELRQHFATGDAVELDGKYIELFEFPDWWKRLYGEFETSGMYLTITSNRSKTPRPTRIEFITGNESEVLPYVELWMVKQGKEETTLSNDQQNIPVKLSIVINKDSTKNQLKVSTSFANTDGLTAIQTLQIQKILSSGGKIKLTLLDSNQEFNMNISPGNFPAPEKGIIEYVQKIILIENVTGIKLRFSQEGSFSKEDFLATNELISIIEKGSYQHSGMVFRVGLKKSDIAKLIENLTEDSPIYIQITTEESFLEILSQKIELGPMLQKIRGYWSMPLQEVRMWLENADDHDSLEVRLTDVELYEEFEKWIKR